MPLVAGQPVSANSQHPAIVHAFCQSVSTCDSHLARQLSANLLIRSCHNNKCCLTLVPAATNALAALVVGRFDLHASGFACICKSSLCAVQIS